MQKRKLAKSNLEFSAIGFGCMGLDFSYGHALSKEESITLVLVGGSNAAFLLPAAGRERGPSWTPLLAKGLPDPTRSPSDRTVARDEHQG
jgi:hypothetical protein